jgi:prepilin-type N-terminal cleavage/methylation domain-containing protein
LGGDELNNERGLTLIEVLATLTISSVLLGVVLMLLSSTSLQAKTSGEKFNADAEIRTTMDTIAKEISDSNQAYAASNDFRYVTYTSGTKVVKSLYYNAADQTLTSYLYNSANIQDNVTLATPGIYTKPRVLTSHLTGVQYLAASGNIPIAGNLIGGSAFRMVLTFTFKRSKMFGGSENYVLQRETGFKLLQY